MGIEAKFVVTITKRCDGCGLSYEGTGNFSHVASVLGFGGPVEAASWKIHVTPNGAHLLCDLCEAHQAGKTDD